MSETKDRAPLIKRKKFIALEQLLEDSKPCTRLSEWEETFLADMRVRVKQYGDRTFISPGQWEKLDQIEEKVYRV